MGQTREIQTKSGDDRAIQSTKLSAAPNRSEMTDASGNTCRGPISMKEIFNAMQSFETQVLTLKFKGAESMTFKGYFGKSDLNGSLMTVKNDNGITKVDLCGAYMMSTNGQEMELWIDRD